LFDLGRQHEDCCNVIWQTTQEPAILRCE
jgi:hypothetical protein